MRLTWEIDDNDVSKLKNFVKVHESPFVARRISRNVNRKNISIDKDSIIKTLIMCLLTTQQRSGPNTPIGKFLRQNPFALTNEVLSSSADKMQFTRQILQQNGLNRYINRIPKFFAENLELLIATKWELIDTLTNELLDGQATRDKEREIADNLHGTFSGFGPKQSRNFLQELGLTKYEIPIDSRITNWLNRFGFPVSLSSISLQDKKYYHFVLDGIQSLCRRADIYPCVLDAVVFASFDNGQWTVENTG